MKDTAAKTGKARATVARDATRGSKVVNARRRNATKSQLAIAAAEAWALAEGDGRVLTGKGGDRKSEKIKPKNGVDLIKEPAD